MTITCKQIGRCTRNPTTSSILIETLNALTAFSIIKDHYSRSILLWNSFWYDNHVFYQKKAPSSLWDEPYKLRSLSLDINFTISYSCGISEYNTRRGGRFANSNIDPCERAGNLCHCYPKTKSYFFRGCSKRFCSSLSKLFGLSKSWYCFIGGCAKLDSLHKSLFLVALENQ